MVYASTISDLLKCHAGEAYNNNDVWKKMPDPPKQVAGCVTNYNNKFWTALKNICALTKFSSITKDLTAWIFTYALLVHYDILEKNLMCLKAYIS